MNVRKRSGKVVPFDAEFIRRAVTLAAAAAGEHEPQRVDDVTAAVEERLAAAGQDIVDIERIQDAVEETLFDLAPRDRESLVQLGEVLGRYDGEGQR